MFHILVVEDDASISNLIRTTLQGRGLSLHLCAGRKKGRGSDRQRSLGSDPAGSDAAGDQRL